MFDLGTDEARRLTAEQMGPLADQLEECIEEFRDWGVRVHESGRLPAAIQVLRQVATSGRFPDSRKELVETGYAVRDGQEFVEIANTMPTDTLRPLAESLQRAVTGDAGTERSQAAQFQSELWVGAMLANSEYRTAVITEGAGKRPDFVVSNGTQLYPVEVKRPAGKLNAAGLMTRASQQLRGDQYHGGGLVVDLSDCLPHELSARFGSGSPDPSVLDAVMVGLTGELNNQIFDEGAGRIRERRDHIFALVTFARSTYWDEDDLTQIYLLRNVASIAYYRGHRNNLRGHRALALSEAIHHGIKASGHQDLGRTEIKFS